MNEIVTAVNRGVRIAYYHFDNMASNMTPFHWAFFAIIVIGTGVILMRGNPVQGS